MVERLLSRRPRALLAAVAVLAAVAAAGCGSSSSGSGSGTGASTSANGGGAKPASSSGVTVLEVSGPLDNPFFGAIKKGSDDAASQLGIHYEYLAPTSENDLQSSLVKLTESAISRRPSALVVADGFPPAQDPVIKKAVAAGIPVVVQNSGQGSWQRLGAVGFVGEEPVLMGAAAGQQLKAAGVTQALCVNGVPGNPTLAERCQGFARALGGTVVNVDIPPTDGGNPTAITQAIRGALASHKDVNGVFTLGADLAVSALQAIDAQGMTGKVKVGTTDLSRQVLADVQSGKLLFVIDQQPYLEGYDAVQMAAQAAQYGVHPVSAVTTGPLVITRDTVGQVLAVNQRAPGVRGSD